jgi:hypothetical protein
LVDGVGAPDGGGVARPLGLSSDGDGDGAMDPVGVMDADGVAATDGVPCGAGSGVAWQPDMR